MDSKSASMWGAIIVSTVTLLTFTGALVVAFVIKDPALLNLTVGAAIANATTAVGFWLGSSSGSQKKDEVIGAALAISTGAVAAVAPVVTAIRPTSGAAGTTVTVTGSGFTGATSVRFGASNASVMTVVSDTEITATSPAGGGTVDVTVVTPAGTSATSPADQFTYI